MNFPAGISIIGVSSVAVTGMGVEVDVGLGLGVGVTSGVGVAVGAACMASASGGKVGSPGAGGVTVGSWFTSQVAGATSAGVSRGLPGVCDAGAIGEAIRRVGNEVTVGDGVANRLGKTAITAKTSTTPRIRIKRVRGFFMATRFTSSVMVGSVNSTIAAQSARRQGDGDYGRARIAAASFFINCAGLPAPTR